MNIIDKYRKELIILGVIIELILVPLIVRNMNILKNKEKQDENIIPVMNEIGKQEFGIKYTEGYNLGYRDYSGSISDALSSGYELNVLISKCTDGANANVYVKDILSINGNIITVKSNKTVYCTLYFDKPMEPLEYVNIKPPNLTINPVGNMYRYQGEDPKNYICFGTFDAVECINDPEHYMYRIIGIDPNGYMKVIKLYGVVDNGYGMFPWDTSTLLIKTSGVIQTLASEAGADWNNADLFKRINGTSNGSSSAANTDLFIDNPEYSYLKSGDKVNGGTQPSVWVAMMDNRAWKWGRTDTTDFDADTLYSIESGQTAASYSYLASSGSGGGSFASIDYSPMAAIGSFQLKTRTMVWNNTINSRINLLYLHDLAYSSPTTGSINDFADSWLYYSQNYFSGTAMVDSNSIGEWYSTGYGVVSSGLGLNKTYAANSRAIKYSRNLGTLNGLSTYDSNGSSLGVRPVFYLLNTLKFYGTGSADFPFMISSPN